MVRITLSLASTTALAGDDGSLIGVSAELFHIGERVNGRLAREGPNNGCSGVAKRI
jgi:hypothetical protein